MIHCITMKRTLLTLVLTITAVSIGLAQETSKPDAYDELVAKLNRGETAVNYKAMRIAYRDRLASNKVVPDVKARVAMAKAYNEKNYKEAVKHADAVLKSAYVDIDTHFVAAMSHQNLGDAKKAKFHESVYVGLVNSIIGDGDGSSAKTAYKVISVTEEAAILRALELKRVSMEPLELDGNKYHVYSATDAANAPVKIFFNVSGAWAPPQPPAGTPQKPQQPAKNP
jgi:hypothetical protein